MTIDSFLTSGNSPGDRSRCRVALVGLGRVGSAVARRLTGPNPPAGLTLTHVFDRRVEQKRSAFDADASVVWTTNIADVLASRADVVVEAVGGVDQPAEWIRAALAAGKSVVTANKQVIARHGPALLTLAERQGRQLRFEGAVGAAVPIVRAVSDGLSGDTITSITAVLNGTTNAVLSRVEETGCTIAEAIADARGRGWAEADPSDDVDGLDAAAKLAILCALAFGLRVDPAAIERRSIAGIDSGHFRRAATVGSTVRQIAHASVDADRGLTAWVGPRLVLKSSIFGQLAGPANAAVINGENAGEIAILGAGAGGNATAVAIISDLLAIARDPAAIYHAPVLAAPAAIHGFDSELLAEAV